ncbi:Hypothetical predicted protein [Cloeon dipterum]|uniref:Cyclin N-terminal domain-containing protein n=1 Tax=Cloeon dipterum TaxID=197152 RepID=A0A8S1DB78_9INSE|nr:Hypothetical predicted protein [Cloeon dipterum]
MEYFMQCMTLSDKSSIENASGLPSRTESRFLRFFNAKSTKTEGESSEVETFNAESSKIVCGFQSRTESRFLSLFATWQTQNKQQIWRVEVATSAALGNIKDAAALVKDIYQGMRQQEPREPFPHCHIQQWREINSERISSIQWLICIHDQLNFLPETLFLAVSIFNRYLKAIIMKGETPDSDLHLACLTSMMIAFKYEESKYSDDHYCIYHHVDSKYPKERLFKMEWAIFLAIDCRVGQPISFEYLWLFVTVAEAHVFDYMTAKYLLELSLMSDERLFGVRPSLLAAAALLLAKIVGLDHEPYERVLSENNGLLLNILKNLWNTCFISSYSGIDYDDIEIVIVLLADVVLELDEPKRLQIWMMKYSGHYMHNFIELRKQRVELILKEYKNR